MVKCNWTREPSPPIPPPPQRAATFDLIGLSESEALGIVRLIGGTNGNIGYPVFSGLMGALDAAGVDTSLEARELRFPDLQGRGTF